MSSLMRKYEKPILFDFKLPLQTERLMLRSVMPGDGKAIYEAIKESYDQFKEWLPWCQELPTVESSEETARNFYADYILKKALHFVIFHGDQFVGMCCYYFNWQIPSADIGYWCRVSAQGRGYMREAVMAITKYALEEIGIKRLTILCDEENVKSIAIAEKSGFQLETRASGLIVNPISDELRMGRRYVRFSA